MIKTVSSGSGRSRTAVRTGLLPLRAIVDTGFEPVTSSMSRNCATAAPIDGMLTRFGTTTECWYVSATERTGIEPAKLLNPAAFKAVSSTNRTLSLNPALEGGAGHSTPPGRPDPRVTPTAQVSVGSRGGGTRTLQFQAVCLTCCRSVHYPRVTPRFEHR